MTPDTLYHYAKDSGVRNRRIPILPTDRPTMMRPLDEYDAREAESNPVARAIIWGAAICLALAAIFIGAIFS